MIGKALFIESIEAIRLQMAYDTAKSEALAEVLNMDEATFPLYDNSLLIKAVINLLRASFPRDANGFCEIDHYCFDMNFGKISKQELITPEDLWDRLNSDKVYWEKQFEDVVSTHPLIDDSLVKKNKIH